MEKKKKNECETHKKVFYPRLEKKLEEKSIFI